MDASTASIPDLIGAAQAGDWPAFKAKGRVTTEAHSFLQQIQDSRGIEDPDTAIEAELLRLAHDLWSYGQSRPSHEIQLARVRPAALRGAQRDVVEVVGPDMHFLVDSIMAELSVEGVETFALFHPIVSVPRGRDSLIQVVVEPLTGQRKEALVAGLGQTLQDVRAANQDFAAMRARLRQVSDDLAKARPPAPADEVAEALAFLRWLDDERFVFLGARDYQFARDAAGEFVPEEPIVLEETGLGILREPTRFVLRRGSEPSMITPQIQRFLSEPAPIVVSKANLVSRVHRRAYADYVGVKRYDKRGGVVGETRFVGLFTSEAYTHPTSEVPLIGPKAKRVFDRARVDPASHNGKALLNILETFPRDEMFQIPEDDLYRTSLGILQLLDRPRPRVFLRRDRFDRYISALAFVPKERFSSSVREAIGEALARAYGGRVSAFYPLIGDQPLARIHYIIGRIPRGAPDPNFAALEAEITALTRTWEDLYNAAAQAHAGEDADLYRAYSNGFSAGYRERFDAAEALSDAAQLNQLTPEAPVRVRAFAFDPDHPDRLRCKLYAMGDPLPLSAALPVLENMGMFVDQELTFSVRSRTGQGFHIHALEMRSADGAPLDASGMDDFEAAFVAVWMGQAENDGFNALVLKLGVDWREAALVRALARFRQQSGLDPSQALQEQALRENPEIVRKILAMFHARFDPALAASLEERQIRAGALAGEIEEGLKAVASLDADRVLRRIAMLVGGIVRTNYYQRENGEPKRFMSFKIASLAIEDLPPPRPYREIWVSGPEVEGAHLRFGPVARGGLRWSDRRDDFRVEVLDLVKAQQVKNAIIVPVGAKGGFFPKRLPARGAANFQATGVSAYKTFLRGLLDVTDNLDGETVVAPTDVVRWDEDDPYLVVAADKGTATFSDIANAVSLEYGHWLGDAFASGGSAGYDHKKMGITARGAWEAVKRHFRELGKDIQTTPFTVIGVGDMSGDVFGNGMLLSRQIKLLAAFDHRHIFLDPAPDPERSFQERERLFHMERSSWADYDRALISPGGGVFSRADKAIPISPEIAAMTGLRGLASVTPSELIAALLKAECELLWFGGIGTYVKASTQSNAEVGDKANDAHRVDAADLRALVIGEGANLGVTQAGRIEFARTHQAQGGGRINTDAVDNSAGVDTSDHEVNIKILLADAMRSGALQPQEREPLLQAMTEDVARLVLRHNYEQTMALTLAEAQAASDLDAGERFMERLEEAGKLSRAVEGLPSAEAVRALRARGQGLTRPELSKLIAYAKIDLFDAIVASPLPDDPYFEATLRAYFPPQLARFEECMRRHRLRREIIATRLADDLVNRCGPTFVDRIRETVRAEAPDIARGFEIARAVFRLEDFSRRVDALDNQAPAAAQTALRHEMWRALLRATIYVVRHAPEGPVAEAVAAYAPAVAEQSAAIWDTMTDQERERAEARAQALAADGAPEDLAREAGALGQAVAALDVADVARAAGWPVAPTVRLFRGAAAFFGLDRLRGAAAGFRLEQHWDRLALRRTIEELFEDQRRITIAAARACGPPPVAPDPDWAREALAGWAAGQGARVTSALATLEDLEADGPWTFAKTILAAAELRSLTGALAS